jgi:ABC-2 type transport system permease protein
VSALAAIIRRETAGYFRTPAGWAVLALFVALQGIVFWMYVQFFARPDAPPGGVMEYILGRTMLFWIAMALLAAVVPMRLVAEERRSGTIEPLMTAPVSAAEVVIGKWLAALVFAAAAWAPTLLYPVYLRAVGAELDAGAIASGYLGTALVAAASLAVGLAASAVTRHQLLAAALSFVVFVGGLLLGAVERSVRTPALAAALRRVSLLRMMDDFSHGIVDSRHVALLATVTVLALVVATAVLARARGPVPADAPPARRWPGRVALPLVALIALLLHQLSGRHYVRGDWTRQSLYALSDRTVAVVSALPRPVDVTVFMYARRETERARVIDGYIRELTERLSAHGGGRFRVAFVDPDRDPPRAEAAARRYGIGAYEMSQGVVVFSSGPRAKAVTWEDLVEPVLDAEGEPGPVIRAWRGEEAFTSALLTVTSDQATLICFSQGHGEPDVMSIADGGYSAFAGELQREGDGVRALERIADARGAGCRVLIVAEPTQALPPGELAALSDFVDGGGSLLAMLGPLFSPDGSAFVQTGLERFAEGVGVRLGDNVIVDPSRASDVEGPTVWAAGPGSYGPHAITAQFGGRLTYWPRTREVAPLAPAAPGFAVSPLVRTSADGWGEADLATLRGDADLAFDPARDRKGPVTGAVAVEGLQRPARLVFLGTGRLVMNARLTGLTLRDYDVDFVRSAIAWLSGRDVRVGIASKPVGRTAPGVTDAQVAWAFRLFVVALPLVLVAAGAFTWARRRT